MADKSKVQFDGPPNQEVQGVEGVPQRPENGETYEVSAADAKALAAGSQMWSDKSTPKEKK